MNAQRDARHAKDAAFGTAEFIDVARRRFPATLAFLAVAGDEQKLNV